MLKDYEEEFCKNVINDSDANEYVKEIFAELMEEFPSIKKAADFIKENLNNDDVVYISELIELMGGDIEIFLIIYDISWDSELSIEGKRDIWEQSGLFVDDFEERLEELREENDDDDDEGF